jgi:hypothetical protein
MQRQARAGTAAITAGNRAGQPRGRIAVKAWRAASAK